MKNELSRLIEDAFDQGMNADFEYSASNFALLEARVNEGVTGKRDRLILLRRIRSSLLTLAYMKEQSVATCQRILESFCELGYGSLYNKVTAVSIFIRRCIEMNDHLVVEPLLDDLRKDVTHYAEDLKKWLANFDRFKQEVELLKCRANEYEQE